MLSWLWNKFSDKSKRIFILIIYPPMTNTARIEKAYKEFNEKHNQFDWWLQTYHNFSEAILNNITPLCRIHTTSCVDSMLKSYDDWYKKWLSESKPQIPVEAVEKLREKYEKEHEAEQMIEAGDVLNDLDILLSQQQQDGDR